MAGTLNRGIRDDHFIGKQMTAIAILLTLAWLTLWIWIYFALVYGDEWLMFANFVRVNEQKD